MRRIITTIKNILSIEELRQKLIVTLVLIMVYRIGTYIILPGINPTLLAQENNNSGLLGLLNMFVGGSFNRASIFALGIMPYISASIAVQLFTLAVPYFQKLQKEGESGRRKINQFTRYLTVAITTVQALGYVTYLNTTANNAIMTSSFVFTLTSVFSLVAGSLFCLWLGEKITDKGIGNGTSFIIMVGILARLPYAFLSELDAKSTGNTAGGLFAFLIEVAILIAIILLVVLFTQGVRRVQVLYAKRMVGNQQFGGARQFIPLRVLSAGVMPIIFAQALMFIPSFVAQFAPESQFMQSIQSGAFYGSFWYNLIYFILVVVFTYLYTALIVNPTQMADDMKRQGGYIPGVKPGQPTADYIDNVVSHITLPGGVFLGLVGILPSFASTAGVNSQLANFFGGTSVLIMISVMLDTLQQIEAHLLNQKYDGLMESGIRIKGRQQASEIAPMETPI